MMLFDTHAHLNAEQYKDDLSEVIERATSGGSRDDDSCRFRSSDH